MCCGAAALGAGRFEAVQEGGFLRCLATGAPQRIAWSAESLGPPTAGRARLVADFRLHRWYVWLLCAGVAGTLALPVLAVWQIEPHGIPSGGKAVLGCTLGILLLGWVPRGVSPFGGGSPMVPLSRALLDHLGPSWGAERFTVSGRYNLAMRIFALLLFCLCAGMAPAFLAEIPEIGILDEESRKWLLSAALVPTVVSCGLLLCAMVLSFRGSVFLRADALLRGIGTATTFCVFLLAWLPMAVGSSSTSLAHLEQAAAAVASHDPAAAHNGARIQAVLSLGGVAFLLVTVIGMVVYLGRAGGLVPGQLAVLSERRRSGIYRQAVGNGLALWALRLPFGAWFAAMVLLVPAGVLLLLMIAGASLSSLAQTDFPGGLVRRSALLIALAVGTRPDHPVLEAGVAGLWMAYALCGLTVLVVSMGQLALDHRRNGRSAAARDAGPGGRLVADLADSLARRAGFEGVETTIVTEPEIDAWSSDRGTLRRRRRVAVSHEAVARLTPEQLEALLAHEMAHLLAGHCRKDRWLRCFGRLACVGDGFVRGLEDSFGYELAADEIAVRRFKIRPETLVIALQRTRGRNETLLWPKRGKAWGLSAVETGADEPPGWQGFLHQYFHSLKNHYWHPDIDERIAHLRRMEMETA